MRYSSRVRSACFASTVMLSVFAVAVRGNDAFLRDGWWQGPIMWPVIGIHSILLPTGEVLQFSYRHPHPHVREINAQKQILAPPDLGAEAFVIDPWTFAARDVGLDRSLFCGGHSLLPDGRALITGGTLNHDPDRGLRDAHVFDATLERWTRIADMQRGRFYPTNVTLADGRTLVLSGINESGDLNRAVEVFDAASGWTVLSGAEHDLELYPRAHLLASGRVAIVGPNRSTETFDVATRTWQTVARTLYPGRYEGTSVALPRQRDRVLALGGFAPTHRATQTTEWIDFTQPEPAWQWGPPMHYQRCFLNAIILLDGNVLVLGGQTVVSDKRTAVLPAEILDTDQNSFRVVASLHRLRVYHSSAVLLADGRVMVAGGDGEHTMEMYWPPYMFRPRPVITHAPQVIRYGKPFSVGYARAGDGAGIREIALLRPGATTHSVSMDQRHVSLAVSMGTNDTLGATLDSPTQAPPGPYLLTVVDSERQPSVAVFVSVQ